MPLSTENLRHFYVRVCKFAAGLKRHANNHKDRPNDNEMYMSHVYQLFAKGIKCLTNLKIYIRSNNNQILKYLEMITHDNAVAHALFFYYLKSAQESEREKKERKHYLDACSE